MLGVCPNYSVLAIAGLVWSRILKSDWAEAQLFDISKNKEKSTDRLIYTEWSKKVLFHDSFPKAPKS